MTRVLRAAAVLFSDAKRAEVEAELEGAVLSALAAAPARERRVFALTRVGRRGRSKPLPPELQARTLTLPPWPLDPIRAGALRVALAHARRPRDDSPEVLIGFGEDGAKVAAATGAVLGAPSVGWVGETWSGEAAGLDDLWVIDDASARRAAACGVRAFRALLAPSGRTHGPGGYSPGPSGRLLLVGPPPADPSPIIDGAQGSSGQLQLAALGPGWPSEIRRFRPRVSDRKEAFEWAAAVLSVDPERSELDLVEALLAGRPVLVPAELRPGFFDGSVGAVFEPDRTESVADALAEVWSGVERGRLGPARLRARGLSESLEVRSEAWVERLRQIERGAKPLSLLRSSE